MNTKTLFFAMALASSLNGFAADKAQEVVINGYGNTVTINVKSANLRADLPFEATATNGFEVSPAKIEANGNAKITVKLLSSKAHSTGKVVLRNGDFRYNINLKGVGKPLLVKDLSKEKSLSNKATFESKKFKPSANGYTVEFKVKTAEEGDSFTPYIVNDKGQGFKAFVEANGVGFYNSTSKQGSLKNPATNVEGGNGKFYNNDGNFHTYRFAVMPDNRAFVYRDGLAVDTVRLSDFGGQPDWAVGNGKNTENLLKNPGFEGEYEMFGVKNASDVAKSIEGWNIAIMDYWNSQQKIKAEQLDNTQDFNNHVATIYPYAWAGGWGNGNINQVVDVVPGKTYTLTALAKGGIRKKEGTLAGTMFIEEMQDREKKAVVKIASDSWETYSLDFTPSAQCKQIRVVFQTEAGKWGEKRSKMEVDNVQLTGMARTYAAKVGYDSNNAKVEYFTVDESGAYAPLVPEVTVDVR